MRKLIFSLFLSLMPLLIWANESGTTGSCTWSYDETTKTLTISGTGAMKNYTYNVDEWGFGLYSVPWSKYWNDITAVNVTSGVTTIGGGAFANCESLSDVSIANTVTTIGPAAFSECKALVTIGIPESVTSIGYWAFSGCRALSSAGSLGSITAVNPNAFSSCVKLTDVTIPETVKTIKQSAFTGCESLESIVIPDKVTTIEAYAFTNCNSLAYLTIGKKVKTIGESAFSGCDNLSDVYLNDLATWCTATVSSTGNPLSIAKHLYVDGAEMTDLVIPTGITSLSKWIFWNCSFIKSVTLPQGLKTIGEYAFRDSQELTSVSIPSSVTHIGDGAFGWCDNLVSVNVGMTSPIAIDENAFTNRVSATLYVPFGCKAAYESADYWKEFKEIIEMPAPSPVIGFADANVKALCIANWDTDGDGELSEAEAAAVNSLGEVFKENTAITSFNELKYFTGITMIADFAFSSCTNLSEVTIPENVVSIGNAAFNACYKLTDVILPNNITSIGIEAFYACITLQTISLPSELKDIEDNAFLGCNQLKQILLPEGLDKIGQCAFQNCNSLTTLHIPGSVRTIGYAAFSSCTSLDSVSFDEGITELGGEVFSGCEKLQSVLLPSTLTQIASGIFSMCTSLEEIHLPNGITGVASDTFHWCGNLKTVNIPESAEFIGINAFGECASLKEIVIPQGVNEILYGAFSNCYRLEKVTSYIDTPFKIDDSVFWNYDENEGKSVFTSAVLCVPKGSKTAYQETKGWKEFKEIVEMGGSEDIDDTDISQLDNVVYINKVEVYAGTETTLSIQMKNTAAIRGFQFDLYLPEGVKVVKNDKGRIQAALDESRMATDDEHTLTCSEQKDGAIRFLCGSQYEETFTGNDGEIATLQVVISSNMDEGDYPLLLKNIKLSESDISKYYEVPLVKTTMTVGSYMLGDINADGKVDVSDYIGVANHILGHTPEGFIEPAGDVDNSGVIDVSDYLGIGNIIHTGSVYGSNKVMKKTNRASDIATMDNVIYVGNVTVNAGSTSTLSLCMKNSAAIRGFQFDLYLPEGITAAVNSKGRIQAALTNKRLEEGDEHTLTTSQQEDGGIRFLCGSQYEETFTGNDGEIATLIVNVDAEMLAGDYLVLLKNMKLSENDIRNYYETELVESAINVNASPTGIVLPGGVSSTTNDCYYNLAGQRLAQPTKGLYIVNGKKVVIK